MRFYGSSAGDEGRHSPPAPIGDGPQAGLTLIDALLARGELADYHLAHSARADLCRRLGRMEEARASYEKALALTVQQPERRFIESRLREVG